MAEKCPCRQCIRDRDDYFVFAGHKFPMEAGMMIVCSTCGNKRCPHAADHRHACTNSNEPGQAGSAYGNHTTPVTGTFIGIDHGRGDDQTTVVESHYDGDGHLHIDEIHQGELARAVAIYWEAYKRQQAGSPRRAGACAAGVAAVLRYARTGPLTLLNLSDTDARDATRYRWWRDNLQLLTDDEAGLHGVASSFQVPWNFIERSTSGEVADAIADAAISAQRVEVS